MLNRALPERRAEQVLTDYVSAHQQTVYTFCYWALGVQGRAQAMTQDVLARAWAFSSSAAYDKEVLRLLRIAYQRCRGALRQKDTGRVCPEPEHMDGPALAPVEDRCLLILRYYCGLTPEEIAVVTDLSLAEVKQRLLQARRALHLYAAAVEETQGPAV